MQYPAQVLWEADIPAGLIRRATWAALPFSESQCSGQGGIVIGETLSHVATQRSPHPLGSSLRPRSPGETACGLNGALGFREGRRVPVGHPQLEV